MDKALPRWGGLGKKHKKLGEMVVGNFWRSRSGKDVVIRAECGIFGTLSQQSLEIWK
jgi:hypothetical protein